MSTLTGLPYNPQKDPPAPFIRLTLRNPHTGAERRGVPAQLDTGADQSLVPAAIIHDLGLEYSGVLRILGVSGSEHTLEIYTVTVEIHSLPPISLEILRDDREPWILLGRDVLNHYRLVLDGPNLLLEIS